MSEGVPSRYAYDLTMIRNRQSRNGDAAVNESYFTWNQPVCAVENGTVVYVMNSVDDNDG